MAMKSCRCGQSAATQSLKQRPNKTGSIRLRRMRSQPCRNAIMEVRELPQKIQVMLAPGSHVIEIVATRNRRAGYQQQDLLERIHDAPGLAVVCELGKVPQKQGQTRTRTLTLEDRVYSRAPVRIRAPTESHLVVNSKLPGQGR